jgi:hypothetical protein
LDGHSENVPRSDKFDVDDLLATIVPGILVVCLVVILVPDIQFA